MFSDTQSGKSGAAQVSVLASDLVITGTIAAQGAIELHGNVDGEVNATRVIVGNEGRVKGRVSAQDVDLRGEMDGALECSALTLRAASRLNADVVASNLVIESGAEVEGRFSRPAVKPQAAAPAAPAPEPAPAKAEAAEPAAPEKGAATG